MNILLIDDDEDDRMVFSNAVESLNAEIQCETATDGADALALLNEKLLFFPDYIFLDLNMPGMTGFQFLSKLKAISVLRTIPVVIYTTSGHDRDVEKAFSLGASGFITKPNSYEVLKKTLRKILVDHVRMPLQGKFSG